MWYAVIMIMIYPIGIPLLYAVVLFKYAARLSMQSLCVCLSVADRSVRGSFTLISNDNISMVTPDVATRVTQCTWLLLCVLALVRASNRYRHTLSDKDTMEREAANGYPVTGDVLFLVEAYKPNYFYFEVAFMRRTAPLDE